MNSYMVNEAGDLRKKAKEIVDRYYVTKKKDEDVGVLIPEDFKKNFFELIDKVGLLLLEDRDNFYGYFLFQMSREIRFDIGGPTAVQYMRGGYVIYFNPIIFLQLSINQMATSVKHEILHIVSQHLVRAKGYEKTYSRLAINMAMDIVVNRYLNDLPPYATTIEWVNFNYALKLKPYETFEYYLEEIQQVIGLVEPEDAPKDVIDRKDNIETEYSIEKTHAIWQESISFDEKTQMEFTKKVIHDSTKGELPDYLTEMIAALSISGGELPWNVYLNRLMGTIEGNVKKTMTRRNRRQPERLELRGQLKSHKAKIIVALDISGSISDDEFRQAIREVLVIIKNYNDEITLIECDDEIRSVYKVKTEKDIRERNPKKGATKFSPVFEYANHNKVNLLIYFTDGKGEDKLKVIPRGYKVLWVISGRGSSLSIKEPYGVVKKLKQLEAKEEGPEFGTITRTGYSMQHEESV